MVSVPASNKSKYRRPPIRPAPVYPSPTSTKVAPCSSLVTYSTAFDARTCLYLRQSPQRRKERITTTPCHFLCAGLQPHHQSIVLRLIISPFFCGLFCAGRRPPQTVTSFRIPAIPDTKKIVCPRLQAPPSGIAPDRRTPKQRINASVLQLKGAAPLRHFCLLVHISQSFFRSSF